MDVQPRLVRSFLLISFLAVFLICLAPYILRFIGSRSVEVFVPHGIGEETLSSRETNLPMACPLEWAYPTPTAKVALDP